MVEKAFLGGLRFRKYEVVTKESTVWGYTVSSQRDNGTYFRSSGSDGQWEGNSRRWSWPSLPFSGGGAVTAELDLARVCLANRSVIAPHPHPPCLLMEILAIFSLTDTVQRAW